MTATARYDIAIMGGGLAGLCLGLQLMRQRPSLRVAIIDKRAEPAPEATFKVGESAVELASWYFSEVLGLKDHLRTAQLPKFGLRYFMSTHDNRDVAQRCEFGPLHVADFLDEPPHEHPNGPGHADTQIYGAREFHGLPLPAYNLDRGRLENHIRALCHEADVAFHLGTRIEHVALNDDGHTLTLSSAIGTSHIRARWVVDASGRAGILKRKLNLAQNTDHKVDAVWFRLKCAIDPDDWSTDADWLGRTESGLRRLSTNHLMGRGYWVWLIPLASGCTSVGIVFDASMHSIKQVNTFERALTWLHAHEPQCANTLEQSRDTLRDFHVMRGGAYGCRRLFSTDRWAITGEAGVYLDPLYSPGSDFIAVSNTLIVDLICQDLDGHKLTAAVVFSETLYQGMFQQYMLLYRGQYDIMGSARVMTAKIVWDTALYFGYTLLLFRNDRFCDRRFFVRAREHIKTTLRLQGTVQALLKRWAKQDRSTCDHRFVDQSTLEFLWELYTSSKTSYDDGALLDRLGQNMLILEEFARRLSERVNGTRSRASFRSFSQRTLKIDLSADMNRLWMV